MHLFLSDARCLVHACCYFLLALVSQYKPEDSHYYHTADYGAPSVSVEWDSEHAEAQNEGDVLSLYVLVCCIVCFVDAPDNGSHEADDINDFSCIEWATEYVDEEQLKPAAYSDDTRYYAIEYCYNYSKRENQCEQRTLEIGMWHLFIIIYEYDGRDTEQVEQVHTDTQTCHIGDEYKPAIAVRFVGMVFPLQYQPEYYSCECR